MLHVKVLVAASLIGAAVVSGAGQHTGRCHVYTPDPLRETALACGHYVTAADVDGSCGSASIPCISTMDGVGWGHEDCGKCFKVTYQRDNVKNAEVCKGEGCPGYKREVYLKIVDSSGSDAKFEMNQVALTRLCPFLCKGVEVCTESADHCVHGAHGLTPAGAPGSCNVQSIPIRYQEVECGTAGEGGNDTGGPDEGGNDTGGPDEGGNDTGGPDEGGNDTGGPDEGGNDTGGPDEGGNDTGGPDEGDAFGRCHVLKNDPLKTHATACGHHVTAADVDGSCGSASKPCISARENVRHEHEDCGKCFKVTYQRDNVKNAEVCKGEGCPGYESEVYIKVVDGFDGSSSDTQFGMNQVALDKLCPVLCKGYEVCTDSADRCVHGQHEDRSDTDLDGQPMKYSGSCNVSKIPIKYQEVKCGDENATYLRVPPYALLLASVFGLLLHA